MSLRSAKPPILILGKMRSAFELRQLVLVLQTLWRGRGFILRPLPPPCILGYEVAGIVESLGSKVQGLSVGDRVVAMTLFGGHADKVCVPGDCVLKIPSNISFESAAALPVNYLAARQMLVQRAALRPSETVLVHRAAGGVGLAILQICQTIGGVRVIGTASAPKHELLRQNGCAYPLDYRTVDYVSEVRHITNGQGVDVVFDSLGGPDWKRGYNLLRPNGRLIAFGFGNLETGGKRNFFHILGQMIGMPWFTPLKLMTDSRTISGIDLGKIWGAPLRDDLKELVQLCQDGRINPIIDSIYPFDRVAEAYQRMEERKNIGKIILTPDSAHTRAS
jgi:NADPH:quinone reductase-like Zn-dependent oxidoreductase